VSANLSETIEEDQEGGSTFMIWLTAVGLTAAMVAIFLYVPTEKNRRSSSADYVFSCSRRLVSIFRIFRSVFKQYSVSLEKIKIRITSNAKINILLNSSRVLNSVTKSFQTIAETWLRY